MFQWKKVAGIIGVLLFLILLQIRNPEIRGPFKGVLGNVLNPFVYYTTAAASSLGNVWSGYINLVDVRTQNTELSRKLDELNLENFLLREKVTQFERLKQLLNFKEAYNFETVACNVIGRNVQGYLKYLIIDRGEKDGVEVRDPVISFNGLVGRVNEVFHSSSQVVVVLNLNSNVSVMNSRTRAVGILRGDGRGHLFVDYYDRLDDAHEGDVMITSGLGGLYPKGLPVGTIDTITKNRTGLFQKIGVEQSVDFYKLENVLIVKRDKK